MTSNTNNSTTMTSRRRRKQRRRKRRIVGGRSRGTDGRVWRARPSVSCDGSLPRGCRPPPTASSSSCHCRSVTDDNSGRSSLSARPRRQNEGGGTPLHHPLRVEHRCGGGNDGIGVVVPASVSASVLVDIEGSTPHVQQAVVRHRCGEVVVLLIGDDSAPPPLRSLSSSQPSAGASSMGASWTRPSQNSPAADAGHATVAAPHLWLPAPQHRT